MKAKVRFLGLDVHAETIAVAVAESDGEVRSLGTVPNRGESIRKLVKKLGPVEDLWACDEAGPTGSVLYWQPRISSGLPCLSEETVLGYGSAALNVGVVVHAGGFRAV